MPFSAMASITIGKVTPRFMRNKSFFLKSKSNLNEKKVDQCAHIVNTLVLGENLLRVYRGRLGSLLRFRKILRAG